MFGKLKCKLMCAIFVTSLSVTHSQLPAEGSTEMESGHNGIVPDTVVGAYGLVVLHALNKY